MIFRIMEEMKMSNNPTHVVTGKVRLSYTHLFTPYANPNGGEPKYSTTILVPKSDIATKQRIDSAIMAAKQAGVAKNWNGVMPPIVAIPVYDGDGARPSDGMPFGDECKGHWVFTASSKQPPQVVDLGLNPIISQSEIYSGIYAAVSVDFFPYANSGKKGIGCGLGNVQKIEDGEPLGSRTSASDDFGNAAGFQPQYQQPSQYAPAQPQYQQAPQQQYIQQPQYPQQPAQQFMPQQPQQQLQQINPITGMPVGGVMGI